MADRALHLVQASRSAGRVGLEHRTAQSTAGSGVWAARPRSSPVQVDHALEAQRARLRRLPLFRRLLLRPRQRVLIVQLPPAKRGLPVSVYRSNTLAAVLVAQQRDPFSCKILRCRP